MTRPRPLLGQVLVETLNVFSPKAFQTLVHENITDIVFFIVCKICFVLASSKRSIQNKEHVSTCEDYWSSVGKTTILYKIAVDSVTLELCDIINNVNVYFL